MINLSDLAKITFFEVLKFERVTLPYLSKLVSYLFGSGLGWAKLGWRNESIGFLLIKMALGGLRNFDNESILGEYWVKHGLPCIGWNSKY